MEKAEGREDKVYVTGVTRDGYDKNVCEVRGRCIEGCFLNKLVGRGWEQNTEELGVENYYV